MTTRNHLLPLFPAVQQNLHFLCHNSQDFFGVVFFWGVMRVFWNSNISEPFSDWGRIFPPPSLRTAPFLYVPSLKARPKFRPRPIPALPRRNFGSERWFQCCQPTGTDGSFREAGKRSSQQHTPPTWDPNVSVSGAGTAPRRWRRFCWSPGWHHKLSLSAPPAWSTKGRFSH